VDIGVETQLLKLIGDLCGPGAPTSLLWPLSGVPSGVRSVNI
jgi:hypothetical protein